MLATFKCEEQYHSVFRCQFSTCLMILSKKLIFWRHKMFNYKINKKCWQLMITLITRMYNNNRSLKSKIGGMPGPSQVLQ